MPFAAVALGAGIAGLRHEARRHGLLSRALTLGVVLVIGLLVLRADWSLIQAQEHARTDVEAGLRDVAPLVRQDTGAKRAFVEGADAGYPGDPFFDVPAIMDRMAAAQRCRPRSTRPLTCSSPREALRRNPGQESYTPDYDVVVTRFGAVRTARRMVGHAGPFAVFHRAPIDVALVGTGWAVDEDTRASDAIPWLREDFELWISSSRLSESEIVIRVEGPQARGVRFEAQLRAQTALPVIRRVRGQSVELCLRARLLPGVTPITVKPTFPRPIAAVGGIRPDERPPPIDRQAAITALSARASSGTCS